MWVKKNGVEGSASAAIDNGFEFLLWEEEEEEEKEEEERRK